MTGAIGIARMLVYTGEVGEPLYGLKSDGTVSDGNGDAEHSFFQEYKYSSKTSMRVFTRREAGNSPKNVSLRRRHSTTPC